MLGNWGNAGTILCFTEDGNTLLNLTPSLTVSYPVITAAPRGTYMALKGSRWVVMETGTGEHFPTVTLLLCLDFYPLCLGTGTLLPKCSLKFLPNCCSSAGITVPAVLCVTPSRLSEQVLFP